MSQTFTLAIDSQKASEMPARQAVDKNQHSTIPKLPDIKVEKCPYYLQLSIYPENKTLIKSKRYTHGMCFATCILTITYSGVETMYHNEVTQKEMIAMKATLLAFWVFIFIVGFLFAKVTF